MMIEPKIRGFICLTAHPQGCAQHVQEQIDYVNHDAKMQGAKRVLVIGASTGYGLASRIVATFGLQAKVIGVAFEKPADEKRTASPGWYNTAAYEKFAHEQDLYAKTINGDAFSDAIKAETAALIRQDLGTVDLIIYSLASPRRQHPTTGEVFNSALKPIGSTFHGKTVDVFRAEVKDINIEPANDQEIANTIAVMGGDDWALWIDYLAREKLLSPSFQTVAYSYLGPELTHAIYKEGTIGQAKIHLKETADRINQTYAAAGGRALVAVNKAVVTQASAAIPVVPLYMSILFKVMKAHQNHEGCIEQMVRLFKQLSKQQLDLDAEGYLRLDDFEMLPAVQAEVAAIWPTITSENIYALTDLKGYQNEFYRLFGFGLDNVDYTAESNPQVEIPSLSTK